MCASKGSYEHDFSALYLRTAMPSLSSQSNRITIIAPIAAGRDAFCHSQHRCWQTCNCNHRQFRLQLTARRARWKKFVQRTVEPCYLRTWKLHGNFSALCGICTLHGVVGCTQKQSNGKVFRSANAPAALIFHLISGQRKIQKLAIDSLLIRTNRT